MTDFDPQRIMLREFADAAWKQFMQELAIKIFGESEAIAGHKIHNLLGSAESHRQTFMLAVQKIIDNST